MLLTNNHYSPGPSNGSILWSLWGTNYELNLYIQYWLLLISLLALPLHFMSVTLIIKKFSLRTFTVESKCYQFPEYLRCFTLCFDGYKHQVLLNLKRLSYLGILARVKTVYVGAQYGSRTVLYHNTASSVITRLVNAHWLQRLNK
jgi:hypothetical protein